jgi:hypothetical protein
MEQSRWQKEWTKPELLSWITGFQGQEVFGDMWIEVMDTQVWWSSKAI